MTQQLPSTIDETTHPYLMRLCQAYRPHTPIPARQELLENRYQLDGHVSMKEITKQWGMDYDKEIKRRR